MKSWAAASSKETEITQPQQSSPQSGRSMKTNEEWRDSNEKAVIASTPPQINPMFTFVFSHGRHLQLDAELFSVHLR